MELAIVSRDETVRRLAVDEGLPTFGTTAEYRRWARRGSSVRRLLGTLRQMPVRPTVAPRLALALLLVVLLVGIGAFVLVPRATVLLYPPTAPLSDAIEMRADPSLQAVDRLGARLPARVSFVIVDINEQALTQGRQPVPSARAIGTATFTSRTAGAVTVPAGTIVMTPSGVRFATGADLPIGGSAGSVGRVAIQAVEAGEAGNVARLEINRIIGPLAGRLAVLNEEPTVGGGEGATPMITEADRARTRQLAAERARAEALNRLRAEARPDETLIPQTLDYSTLEETFDRAVGDTAATFNYRLRARVSGISVGTRDVAELARARWSPPVPKGYFLPPEQLRVGAPEVVRREDRAVVVRVPVETVAVAEIDPDDIRARVRWRDPDEARRDIARTVKLAAEPRITIEPRWAWRAWRVNVVLDLNRPGAARG